MRKAGEHSGAHLHRAYQLHYGVRLPAARFHAVCNACNAALVELLLAGREIKLPFGVGTLYVEKKKMNFAHALPLDYGHWQKTGEKRFHLNRHSDGFRARFHWRKQTVALVNKSFYAFVPARAAARALAQVLLSPGGHKSYQQYEPLFNKQKKAPADAAPLNQL